MTKIRKVTIEVETDNPSLEKEGLGNIKMSYNVEGLSKDDMIEKVKDSIEILINNYFI